MTRPRREATKLRSTAKGFCVYHSQAQDWNKPGSAGSDWILRATSRMRPTLYRTSEKPALTLSFFWSYVRKLSPYPFQYCTIR